MKIDKPSPRHADNPGNGGTSGRLEINIVGSGASIDLGVEGRDWIEVDRMSYLQSTGLLRFRAAKLRELKRCPARVFLRCANPSGALGCFVEETAEKDPTCITHPKALMLRGSYASKNSVLQEGCVIGAGAFVGTGVVIGEFVKVEAGANITKSIRQSTNPIEERRHQSTLLEDIGRAAIRGDVVLFRQKLE